MGTSPKNILVNKSGRDRYTRPTDIDNVIKYELRKNKKPKIAKTLNNKRNSGGITIPDLKLYHRAIVIKIA